MTSMTRPTTTESESVTQVRRDDGSPSLRVLISGGGTIAPIDEVRWIGNFSTGSFAARIAEAFLERGARVWHVHTPTSQRPYHRSACWDLDADPVAERDRLTRLTERWRDARARLVDVGLKRGDVEDYRSTLKRLLQSEPIDAVIHAMAVSDYQPDFQSGKLDSRAGDVILTCRPVPKVIVQVKDWAPRAILVGFKLLVGSTREELIATARRAMTTTRADLTVANDLVELRQGRHTIHLVEAEPDRPVETIGPERDQPGRLAERVADLVARRGMSGGDRSDHRRR